MSETNFLPNAHVVTLVSSVMLPYVFRKEVKQLRQIHFCLFYIIAIKVNEIFGKSLYIF